MALAGCREESRLADLWPRTSRGAAPGGAHETVSPRPENRHTAPGALPLPEEPGPLPVGARLGGLWGGACFFALKRPFPPSRPSTRPQLGATALKFHKICTTRSATRAPWRWRQPWAAFSCWVCLWGDICAQNWEGAGGGRGGITISRGGQPHDHKQDPRDSALGCSSVSARQQASLPPHWLLSHP